MRIEVVWPFSWIWAACAACGAGDDPGGALPIVEAELVRVTEGVEVRAGGLEARFELIANGSKIAAHATHDDGFSFEAVASISPALLGNAEVRFGEETAAIEAGGGRARLLGSPAVHLWAFELLGPYHEGVTSRLPEAERIYQLIALSVASPVVWPPLGDPRDEQPPGMISGDRPGIGMTCSEEIRCPNAAPFCTTETHDAMFGFCTRACESDRDCATSRGIGRCALPLWDIPGVSVPVQSCAIICDEERACPALLGCGVAFGRSDSCVPPEA